MKILTGKNGELKWGLILLLTVAAVVISFIFLGKEIAYGFVHRFSRSGIWMLIGVASFVGLFIGAQRYAEKHADETAAQWMILGGWVILFSTLLGAAAGLKEDRKTTIPDVAVYWANGKVKNATDNSKDNWYFKHFDVSEADSLYIVQYSEEPGYNIVWRSAMGAESSTAPRSNEDWDIVNKRKNIR